MKKGKEGITQVAPDAPKKKNGRPSLFNKKMADTICLRLSKGESLRSICRDPKMPEIHTILRWIFDEDKKEFQKAYELAREIQAEVIFEETVEIADDSGVDISVNKTKTKKGKSEVTSEVSVANNVAVHRARLRVDTRKWFLARMKPKRFGEKIDVTSGGKELKQPRGAVINYLVPKPAKA